VFLQKVGAELFDSVDDCVSMYITPKTVAPALRSIHDEHEHDDDDDNDDDNKDSSATNGGKEESSSATNNSSFDRPRVPYNAMPRTVPL